MIYGDRSIHLPGRPIAVLPASLSRYAAAATLALLVAAALMVVARRLAGALANPLEPVVLLPTGVLAAAAATAIRLGWFWPSITASRRLDWSMMVGTSLAVAALGAGLCLPDTPVVGKVLFCTLLVGEEAWAWGWRLRHRITLPVPRPPSPAPRRWSFDSDAAAIPAEVTQQLTRSQAADGAEELSGWLRMAFAAGQRTGSLHVAFCPPFAATPELEVEQLDGPEARIKTAQLLPYGVRLDLKLAAAAEEPASVVLQFSARTPRESV